MDNYDSEYNNILEDIETSTTGPEITGNTVVDAILNTDSVSSYRKKLTNVTYSAQAKNQIIKDKTLEKSSVNGTASNGLLFRISTSPA